MSGVARSLVFVLAVIGLIASISATYSNLTLGSGGNSVADLPVLRTESPQQTLESFVELKSELESARDSYERERSREHFELIVGLAAEFTLLIDLSSLPDAVAGKTGVITAMALLEISDLIPPFDLNSVPDETAMRDQGFTAYTVPGTPLRLRRISEGEREGEFLFESSTVRIAPRVLNGLLSDAPSAQETAWRAELERISGPWIPVGWIAALPESMTRSVWGTATWKVLATITIGFVLTVSMFLVRSMLPSAKSARLLSPVSRLFFTASMLPILLFVRHLLDSQIVITGTFADAARFVFTVIWYGALAAIFWYATLAAAAALRTSAVRSSDESNQSLLNLLAHVIGLLGAVWIAAFGLQSLGLPVFSLIAGLGIGGLAVALAVRPTLENLIGGLVIYISKPVRVGDWCQFGTHSGTVERIGVRSTSVRAMDRTLISIPNAQFSNMELVNWAQCDQMLIDPTIGLIYDTSSDQLRYVLAEARRMALSHPKIDSDSVRIRFVGYGESSLDISFRVYAEATEWNDFYAIREDFLLRLKDIVEAAGTSFAFPSHTLYVARDKGRDPEKTAGAEKSVEAWRRHRDLPFPNFSEVARGKMVNSIEYPPVGSPDRGVEQPGIEAASEPLSAEPANETEGTEPSPSRVSKDM